MDKTDLETALRDSIAKVPVGKKVAFNFKGNPNTVDIEMTFKGGWVVTQTIFPGRAFEFIKGEPGYLESINITIKPFEGLKNA